MSDRPVIPQIRSAPWRMNADDLTDLVVLDVDSHVVADFDQAGRTFDESRASAFACVAAPELLQAADAIDARRAMIEDARGDIGGGKWDCTDNGPPKLTHVSIPIALLDSLRAALVKASGEVSDG